MEGPQRGERERDQREDSKKSGNGRGREGDKGAKEVSEEEREGSGRRGMNLRKFWE